MLSFILECDSNNVVIEVDLYRHNLVGRVESTQEVLIVKLRGLTIKLANCDDWSIGLLLVIILNEGLVHLRIRVLHHSTKIFIFLYF
jgi:hypothetical protein